jgi:hypothetical protein
MNTDNNGWISGKENEPYGETEKYIVYIKGKNVTEICWCPDTKNGQWLIACHYIDKDVYVDNEFVTHWMLLPNPPQK